MANHEWDVFVEEAGTALRTVEESLLDLETEPASAEELNALYRGLHTLKGSSGFLSLRSFARVAHACEELVGLARDHGVPLDGTMVNLLLEAIDKLRAALHVVASEHRDLEPAEVDDLVERIMVAFRSYGGTAHEAVNYDMMFFDGAEDEVVTCQPDASAPAATPSAQVHPTARPARAARAEPEVRTEFLRIDGVKVSALMDLAGELGLACDAVTHHPDLAGRGLDNFSSAAHKLELLVREIQSDLSALRLVPITPLFQRMRRVVRDVAMATGKDIELALVGEDTEVDKVMLDAIQDPLVHMLRNAVDHGIESAEQRAAAGKPAKGRLTLSATQQGGEVSIEVRDDGGGIDRTRVVARARERGLWVDTAEPTEAQVASFVFMPGFSTKADPNEISGRGVGLDVVKTTVERLRGHVTLSSSPGQGSRMKMTVPLTLAFVEAMVVREHGRLFAVPIEKVFEVSKLDRSRVFTNPADGHVTIWMRDTCVPVVWLHQFWDEARTVSRDLHGRMVVFVQTSRGAVALPVDELVGNQQVMLKPLKGALSRIRAAAGCGMLRTGDVAIALDCDRLCA